MSDYRFTPQTYGDLQDIVDRADKYFPVTYNTTTYADILGAVGVGKTCICQNSGKVFTYQKTEDNTHYFTSVGTDGKITIATVTSSDVWATLTLNMATEDYADNAAYAQLMQDTASGAIASFPDGAKNTPVVSLKADINPVQDLHEQASPYPENGGKNKALVTLEGIKNANKIGTWSGNVYSRANCTFTVNVDNGGNVVSIVKSGTANAKTWFQLSDKFTLPNGDYILSGMTTSGENKVYAHTFGVERDIDIGSFTYDSATDGELRVSLQIASGDSATRTIYPMIRLSTEADATFAPYSNICPISGFTGANITVEGVNVWDEEWELGYYSNTDGTPKSTTGSIRSKATSPIRVGPNTAYYYVFPNTTRLFAYYYDKFDNFISYVRIDTPSAVTTPNNCEYVRFGLEGGYGTTYGNNTSINSPSTDTSYHAYNGTVYSIDWTDEGTVYHGSLSYIGNRTWKLRADYGDVDMGDLTWTLASYYGTVPRFGAPIATMKNADARTLHLYCSEYQVIDDGRAYEQVPSYAVYNTGTPATVYVHTPDYGTDASAFAASVEGQTLLYPLATPVEYTLTDDDILTLLGANNIWTDTNGDIEVNYRCNTALYIQKVLG